MAWIYFQELEGSPLRCKNGSTQSRIVKLTDIARPFCYRTWRTAQYKWPPFGTIYLLSVVKNLTAWLILFTGDFLARISALQEMEWAWKESEASYFLNYLGCVGKLDRHLSSWKMCQLSLLEGSTEFYWNSMRSGTMRDGRLYQPQKLAQNMYARDCFYWPTPTAHDANIDCRAERRRNRPCLEALIKDMRAMDVSDDRNLNPCWIEYIMLYPIGHTELKPWAIQWLQRKQEKLL